MKAHLALLLLALAGGAEASRSRPYPPIAENEVLHFVGTEPFWGGEVRRTRMTYDTPDNPKGETIRVSRFSSPRGVSYVGSMHGEGRFTMNVWLSGRCSDGMSDRTYPFEVRIKFAGGNELQGCGWTGRRPFRGGD